MRPFTFALAFAPLLVAGCATSYRWGAMDDPEWAPRIGQATYAEVARALGQPVETLPLPSGDVKVRWYARPIAMSDARGTMEDYSVRHTEERAYWRDMRFDRTGRLTRAWQSDQRSLAESEGP